MIHHSGQKRDLPLSELLIRGHVERESIEDAHRRIEPAL